MNALKSLPKLCLHAGGIEVAREQLSGLALPAATNSHVPIPHLDLVNMTVDRLAALGMSVLSEQHALSHENKRYFGMFALAGNDGCNADSDYQLVLGLRNSHDKTFPAGLSLGTRVFVCDNLAFNGEVKISRKHTRYIMRDLPRLATVAVGRIVESRECMAKRIEKYKNHELTDLQAHDLIVRSLDHQIVGATKIEKVVREWRKPAHQEFEPRNAWSLFNAFTETMKEYNGEGIYKRTQPLHGMFDTLCGITVNGKASNTVVADVANN